MGRPDSIPCRFISAASNAQSGAVSVLFTVSFTLLVLVIAEGVWTLSGAGLVLTTVGFAVAIASTRPQAGVIELVDGAIRIRRTGALSRFMQRDRVVAAASLDDGYLLTPSKLVLRLQSGGTLTAELPDDRAHDVLEHLGLALEHRVLTVRLRPPFDVEAWVVGLVLAVWVFAGPDTFPDLVVGFLLSAALAAVCIFAVARWLKPRVVVGLDGVRVVGVLRSRFIAYADIKGVGRTGASNARVILETAAGRVRLSCVDTDEEAIAALVARIQEGRAASAASPAVPLGLLDRRERSVPEWRAALNELALGKRGFRSAALGEDDLDDALSDPEAPLERRVGAALALRSRSDDARTRIRVAAETCAEPRARLALEAAARDEIDERAIERALDKAEPPHAREA